MSFPSPKRREVVQGVRLRSCEVPRAAGAGCEEASKRDFVPRVGGGMKREGSRSARLCMRPSPSGTRGGCRRRAALTNAAPLRVFREPARAELAN